MKKVVVGERWWPTSRQKKKSGGLVGLGSGTYHLSMVTGQWSVVTLLVLGPTTRGPHAPIPNGSA